MSDPRPDRVRNAEDTVLALHAEIERLRRFLEMAVDAYEDEHGQPHRQTHWAAQARALLNNQQNIASEKP